MGRGYVMVDADTGEAVAFGSWDEAVVWRDAHHGCLVSRKMRSLSDAEAARDHVARPLPDRSAVAYTDGSATRGLTTGAAILHVDGRTRSWSESTDDPRVTAHAQIPGELLAATHAIRMAREECAEALVTVFDYWGVMAYPEGLWAISDEWARGLAREAEAARSEGIDLHFFHVRSHTGADDELSRGNDAADVLCRATAERFVREHGGRA